ncbi:8271_t:CDS:2 [Diversispora eburnea]|uniref:8271_t:CDS:1 n=1 Tax=Diversispora eburnea TaxID=1213867 RepID=A0A9N8YSG5_9GLOM|nr:8271_t:CDS:2 [Diversispora eburnea]
MPKEYSSIVVIICHQTLFLLTGFYQTLAAQYLYYQGAATGTSLLTNTAQYVGMASVGLLLIPSWWANRKGRKSIAYEPTGTTELDFDMEEIKSGKKAQKDYQLLPNADEEILIEDSSMISDKSSKPKESISFRFIAATSCLDVVANFTLTIGFFYVGSGMFQVIYSSVVIWCAVLSFIFLGRKLSLLQSISIIGVCFGLALSALGISKGTESSDQTTPPPVTSTGPAILHSFNMTTTMYGMILTSLATFGYACVYVVNDLLVSNHKANTIPPTPEKACFLVGSGCTFLSLMYIIIYTIPHWNKLVIQEMEKEKKVSDVSTFVIIIIYMVLTMASFIHNLSYYSLMKRIGNVSTGLLNSIRAIVVFGLSHILFCDIDNGQCFNPWKGFSAITVIGFVTIFSISKMRDDRLF